MLVDLSHTIGGGMSLFPTLPPPDVHPLWSHEESARSGRYQGCTCEVTEIRMATSLGTYLDSPFHFHPQGRDVSQLSLEECVREGICLDLGGLAPREGITAAQFPAGDWRGKALLLCTGWSQYWGGEAYYNHPFVTRQAALALMERGIGLLGMDTLTADDPRDPTRPTHSLLLPRGILIVENLVGLEAILSQRFTFVAAAPKIQGAAAFPIRAFAITDNRG
ncbi:MAG: cyclase family protein [Chloroflexi bacterium]|nr:cyclase family protein [Chloroflexota bacterium]